MCQNEGASRAQFLFCAVAGSRKGRRVSDPCAILTVRCSARAARRAPHRTAPGAAPPLSARAPPLSARAAYRAARGAAQRRAGRGRRAHRCAAPHRSPERTSAPRRAAAAHALSTSRSVLHTDHLRAAPS